MRTISKLLYALRNKNVFFYYQKPTITFNEYLDFKIKTNENIIKNIIVFEYNYNPKHYWLYHKINSYIFNIHSIISYEITKIFLLYWSNICK